jgi:acetoin utilization deacetylase AcuC-like enzyme
MVVPLLVDQVEGSALLKMAMKEQSKNRQAQVSLVHSSSPFVLNWDCTELLERLDGDQEFFDELLRIFRQDCGANLQNARNVLREAICPALCTWRTP